MSHWPHSAVLWPLQLLKPNSRPTELASHIKQGMLLTPSTWCNKMQPVLHSSLLYSLSDHFPDVPGPNVKPTLGSRVCLVTKAQTGDTLKWQWPSCSFWPQKDSAGGKDLCPFLEISGYSNILWRTKGKMVLGYALIDKSSLKQHPYILISKPTFNFLWCREEKKDNIAFYFSKLKDS